jgi:hypothetical protein
VSASATNWHRQLESVVGVEANEFRPISREPTDLPSCWK